MSHWCHKYIHLHGAVKLLQLSIFTLSHHLQGADELGDSAVQASQQLCQAALLFLLRLELDDVYIFLGGDGCNAGKGTCLAEQSFTLWLRHIWEDRREATRRHLCTANAFELQVGEGERSFPLKPRTIGLKMSRRRHVFMICGKSYERGDSWKRCIWHMCTCWTYIQTTSHSNHTDVT